MLTFKSSLWTRDGKRLDHLELTDDETCSLHLHRGWTARRSLVLSSTQPIIPLSVESSSAQAERFALCYIGLEGKEWCDSKSGGQAQPPAQSAIGNQPRQHSYMVYPKRGMTGRAPGMAIPLLTVEGRSRPTIPQPVSFPAKKPASATLPSQAQSVIIAAASAQSLNAHGDGPAGTGNVAGSSTGEAAAAENKRLVEEMARLKVQLDKYAEEAATRERKAEEEKQQIEAAKRQQAARMEMLRVQQTQPAHTQQAVQMAAAQAKTTYTQQAAPLAVALAQPNQAIPNQQATPMAVMPVQQNQANQVHQYQQAAQMQMLQSQQSQAIQRQQAAQMAMLQRQQQSPTGHSLQGMQMATQGIQQFPLISPQQAVQMAMLQNQQNQAVHSQRVAQSDQQNQMVATMRISTQGVQQIQTITAQQAVEMVMLRDRQIEALKHQQAAEMASLRNQGIAALRGHHAAQAGAEMSRQAAQAAAEMNRQECELLSQRVELMKQKRRELKRKLEDSESRNI